MELFRLYAFEVTPQRKIASDERASPAGGAFPVNTEIQEILDNLLVSSKLPTQATVDFRADGSANLQQRRNIVRELVMDFAFGTPPKAKAATQALAQRLGGVMDDRSPPTLLMLTASRNGSDRRATLWAFPQDEGFQFRPSRSGARIKVLKDIFSRSSRLRKAALFEGKKRRMDFWSGRILDLQSTGGFGKAADYWITSFLECRFGMEGEAGTKLLAKYLQSTYESVSGTDREQLYSAMVAIRTSPKQTWSMAQFARQYLQDDVKERFVQSVSPEQLNLSFKFQRDVFEAKLNFRVFQLENNIYVSAPFDTVGDNKAVRILDGQQRKLRCEGVVVNEQVRSRRGG
ncbi:MAG: nucleoid-associated protein [Thermoguttaceae bacterium]